DPGRAAALLSNDLQRPVANRHPEIGHAERQLLDAGALAAIMCGSGPTVAGLARSDEDAERSARAIPGSIPVSAPKCGPGSGPGSSNGKTGDFGSPEGGRTPPP